MKTKTYKSIGLMSGTSLDGLDICAVEFSFEEPMQFDIVCTETIPYPEFWQEKLNSIRKVNQIELQQLHYAYGTFLGETVIEFEKKFGLTRVEYIASHGHTVFHQPEKLFTFQLGDGAAIANACKKTVVCDFRTQDVQLGGQGAPLVPIGDELLFNQYDTCVNLGGFINISFSDNNLRKAFDIVPMNTILNYLAHQKGEKFDQEGQGARAGRLVAPLFRQLNQLTYYQLPPPKSMGVEWMDKNIFPLFERYKEETINDLLHTYTRHAAFQVAKVFKQIKAKNILITGGGAYNQYFIELLQNESKTNLTLPDHRLIEYKEALIFAILGGLRLLNIDNIWASVTGAKKDHCSGKIYQPT